MKLYPLPRLAIIAMSGASVASAQVVTPFGTTTIAPALNLNGAGSNVDSIAFWEAEDPSETRMFVTGKGNDVVEVWKFPFAGNELPEMQFPANVNGVAVDQETDLLYVTDRIVSVFSIPDLQARGTFGSGTIGVGENNLDLLKHTNGQTWIYVSEDHNVHRFDVATRSLLGSFAPPVSSIETVLADDFHQRIYVAEEQGPEGNPGVYAYNPDGTAFEMNGTNLFGDDGEFDSDEEGMLLYTFPAHGSSDNGTGFIVVSDQRADVTDFEFFDRQTWEHLGVVRLTGVSNTDGIASTQRALPGYPLGVFAAIDDDTSTAIIGWDVVFSAIGWDLSPEAVSIVPGAPVGNEVGFEVVFSEPVSGFNDAADLIINHLGTASTGVVVSGSGAEYSVTITGITGAGSFTVAVSTTSDVVNLVSSVISAPVSIGTPYDFWAVSHGLVAGVNDDPLQDPDGDGRLNVVEFATDGDPLSGGDPGKSRLALIKDGEDSFFTWTFPVRDGAVFSGAPLSATMDGVGYTIAGSVDLAVFDRLFTESSPALLSGLPALGDAWSYRTFRMDGEVSANPAGFARLTVAMLP